MACSLGVKFQMKRNKKYHFEKINIKKTNSIISSALFKMVSGMCSTVY